jgi:hypothetical protein
MIVQDTAVTISSSDGMASKTCNPVCSLYRNGHGLGQNEFPVSRVLGRHKRCFTNNTERLTNGAWRTRVTSESAICGAQ